MFSLDILATILVSQNNWTAVMLVSQTKHVGFELYSFVYTFFIEINIAWLQLRKLWFGERD